MPIVDDDGDRGHGRERIDGGLSGRSGVDGSRPPGLPAGVGGRVVSPARIDAEDVPRCVLSNGVEPPSTSPSGSAASRLLSPGPAERTYHAPVTAGNGRTTLRTKERPHSTRALRPDMRRGASGASLVPGFRLLALHASGASGRSIVVSPTGRRSTSAEVRSPRVSSCSPPPPLLKPLVDLVLRRWDSRVRQCVPVRCVNIGPP